MRSPGRKNDIAPVHRESREETEISRMIAGSMADKLGAVVDAGFVPNDYRGD